MVATLVKPGIHIIASLTPEQAHVWHMLTGLMGEVGELIDALKKNIIYGKDLDRENVKEELGDIEFYLEGVRQGVMISREDCLEHNINKLGKRYQDFLYSDQQAQARADKS